ncbi:45231_t:CDS:2, partial [Gigaspora margarita]
MRMLLGEAVSNNLEPLPDSPDLIPEHITEFLPFALPITNHYNTLSHLSELRASLKEHYHFIRIPPLYSDLLVPEKKDLLPLTLQKLPLNLHWLFPLDPILSPRDFSDMVGILREKYEFRRLPNSYILARPFIPNDPSKIKMDLIYIYPISNKQLAITFLTKIKRRYKFRLLLPCSIITINPTDKPELPRKVKDIYDFSITTSITTLKQLVDTAHMLRVVYFFDTLPEEWIDMVLITLDTDITTKLDLPLKLEELTSYVKDNIPDIATQVPITDYDTATQMIRAIQNNIWTTSNILTNCPGINISPSTGSTDSDHAILDIKWLLPQALTARNKKKTTRKKYLYYKMTKGTWKEFSPHITDWMFILKLTPDSLINDVVSLNKHWHKWNIVVKEAAN